MNTRPLLLAGILAGFITFASTAMAQYWTLTSAPGTNWGPIACSADGSKIVAGIGANRPYPLATGPIYISSDRGTTWTPTSSPLKAWVSLASSADGNTLLAGPQSGVPHFSIDAGTTWTPAPVPFTNWAAVACSADGTLMLASGAGRYIYQSTDSGASWVAAPGLVAGSPMALSADGRLVVIAVNFGNIYTFTNLGPTWQMLAIGPDTNWVSVACSADGKNLVAATQPLRLTFYPGEIFTSSDYGSTWQRTGSPGAGWRAVTSSADGTQLAAISTRLGYPETSGAIFFSTNSGATWTNTPGTVLTWQGIASSADGSLKWATASTGIYYWQATPAPVLNISASVDTSTISWIIPSGNFRLQQNPDLTPGNWTDVSLPPVLDYNTLQYNVTLPIAPGSAFYRLIGK
jgi:photosystem II stability/assembly factor-like uncharacterized protein